MKTQCESLFFLRKHCRENSEKKKVQNEVEEEMAGLVGAGGHLLSGDPAAFSECLLTVDVNWIDANKPETQDAPAT